MIIESLSSLSMWFIELLFSGFSALSLPTDLISTTINIMKYGAYVIGGDLVALVFGCILFWLTFKFTAGLVLFIWRLIPLT